VQSLLLSGSKKRSKKFRDGLDKLALKLPIFGDLVYKAIIAVIAARLQQLLRQVFP
jgi:type II secretory pathway component PulF